MRIDSLGAGRDSSQESFPVQVQQVHLPQE